MIKPPTPDNEKERLRTLHEYEVLGTLPENHFDEITKTASLICECKIAAISLVDRERQCFKSTQGIDATESPRDFSFCGHAILSDDLMVVEDAENDERFCENPFLLTAPSARFYAGAPLIAPNGHRIGTLCVIDDKPRTLSEEQKLLLKTLSKQVVNYLELAKRKVREVSKLRELETYKKGLDAHAIIARTDKSGRITYVNDKFCEISKYSRDELIGKDHRIINSGYHTSEFIAEIWSSISKDKFWRGEIRNRAKDGSLYWVDTTIIPLKDEKGEIQEYMSFRYDITSKKETEYLLDEAQKIAKVGGWSINAETGELHWTDETYRIVEVEIGSPLMTPAAINLYAEHDRPRIEKCLTNCIEKGISFESNFEFYTAKGNKKWVQVKGEPEFRSTGRVIRIIGTFQDITERVLAEEEYKIQKNSALHNAKLASIGVLAAGVGHEVNNPLAIVNGYIWKMKRRIEKNEEVSAGDLEDYLEKINVATDRISKIVLGLRTFSSSDTTKAAHFSPVEAVKESFDLIKEIFENDGVKIHLHENVTDQNLSVNANRGNFQQVLMNLISNAKDSMENSKNKSIDISIVQKSDQIEISVKDTGHGIPKDLQEKVFDPFFTTKEVNKGTGFGLSLVHNFIKDMEGKVRITSEENKGSVFTLELPIISDCRTAEVVNIKSPAPAVVPQKAYAILADDEEGIRELLLFMLEDMGLNVTPVKNGKEAYDLYIKDPGKYDLIISDMKMPEMDGPTLLKSIRAKQELEQPKFIFITGGIDVNFEDSENGLNCSYDGYLLKPFDENAIIETVSGCLNEKYKNAA